MLAAAIGLALAVAGALLIEFLDDTVKTPDDVKDAVGLPVLGNIVHFESSTGNDSQNLIVSHEPLSPAAEAYRTVRTNIRVFSVDKPLRTLVVTSPNPSDGKTTLVANLGVVMAQAGRRVVLVDTDLRRCALHRFFEVANREGLTNALLEDEPVLDGWLRETDFENLKLLTSGPLPLNPSELLGSQKMRRLVEAMNSQADIVILDAPPNLVVTDASVLALEADGVLLLAESGRTRRTALQQSVEQLRQLGVRILGVVLNDVPPHRSHSYYYQYRQKPEGKE